MMPGALGPVGSLSPLLLSFSICKTRTVHSTSLVGFVVRIRSCAQQLVINKWPTQR